MSAAVLKTPPHEHLSPSFASVSPPTTHPSFASSISSYSVVSASGATLDAFNAPQLGSSHSESEPHFPGAWLDTAPGTPAPLQDNQANLAQQVKTTNLLPPAVVQFPCTSFV